MTPTPLNFNVNWSLLESTVTAYHKRATKAYLNTRKPTATPKAKTHVPISNGGQLEWTAITKKYILYVNHN